MDWFRPAPPLAAKAPRPHAKPGLLNIAIVGRFKAWSWGQYPDEAYLARELEALGVNVMRFEQTERAMPVVGVDWAIFTAHEKSRFHMTYWRQACPTMLWTLDWLPGMAGREAVIKAASRASLFVTSDQYPWGREGIAHHKYLPGACEGETPEFQPTPKRPCAFLGSIYSKRRERIADIVRRRGGEILGEPGSWIYGNALAKYVQETKVVVGDNWTNDVQGYWSTRNFVIPGAGGFLLASRVPGLEAILSPEKHIGVYSGLENLDRELDRWIRDNDRREEVRREGFLHVRTMHTWKARAPELLRLMGCLPEKPVLP